MLDVRPIGTALPGPAAKPPVLLGEVRNRLDMPCPPEVRTAPTAALSKDDHGLQGGEFLTAYAASKFGVEGWMESLGLEVAPFGIRTMLVEPGSSAPSCSHRSRRSMPNPRSRTTPSRPSRPVLPADPEQRSSSHVVGDRRALTSFGRRGRRSRPSPTLTPADAQATSSSPASVMTDGPSGDPRSSFVLATVCRRGAPATMERWLRLW